MAKIMGVMAAIAEPTSLNLPPNGSGFYQETLVFNATHLCEKSTGPEAVPYPFKKI